MTNHTLCIIMLLIIDLVNELKCWSWKTSNVFISISLKVSWIENTQLKIFG